MFFRWHNCGNEIGWKPWELTVQGHMALIFNVEALDKADTLAWIMYVILSIVSTICVCHLSYKSNFFLHGFFFFCGTF